VTAVTFGRITQRSTADVTLRGLQANLATMQKWQGQLSSGHRISQPSDDPSGTAAAMLLSSQKAADDQYLRNIGFAKSRLDTTDSALQSLSTQLQVARNLIVQSRNASLNTPSLTALSQQMTQVRSEVIDLYNTRYLDRPVFGGTAASATAVDRTTGDYLGNDAAVSARISADSVVRVDVKGTDIAADSVPALLDQVATNINTGVASDDDLDAIDAALSKVAQALGDVGARESRITDVQNLVTSHQIDLGDRISQNVDIDLPLTIMNLQTQQVAYQTALGAAAKIMQKSLADFLS
jgi:flagellar hook-associated protein 3 FlgL